MSPPAKRMKITKRVTTIDDLPPEIIYELFEHLPPKDLVACSMVNKLWHSIYSNFKVHSVVAIEDDTFRWHSSNQLIQEAEQCSRAMFRHLAEKPLFSNLKHLAVHASYFEPEFDLNELNRFQQLFHLEIKVDDMNQRNVHFNLPKLKVLAFHHYNWRCALSIDCPLLSTLAYPGEDANLLKVKQPETMRKLKTNMVSLEWLVPFKNVECLVTNKFEAISKDTLLSLPRLRELQYNKDIKSVFGESRHGPGTVDRIKRTLNEFLNEAKELRGSNFRFRFAGLQLTNKMLEQIDFGVEVNEGSRIEYLSNEYVYMKNYQLIEPGAIDFVYEVDYTRLLSHVTEEFPLCFSQKFTGIRWVYAKDEVEDPDHFLWFLKSLRSLRELELEETGLSQKFYYQLPASAPLLRSLKLGEGHCEDGLEVNFDFIGRLSRLSSLHIEPDLSLESFPSLVRSLDRLDRVESYIQLEKEQFEIKKDISLFLLNRHHWTIKRAGKMFFKAQNPEEILNFFEDLQD